MGNGIYSFKIPYSPTNKPLEEDIEYSVSLSKYRENRSLEQNRLLWELITRIVKAENGGRSTEDDRILLYCKLLKECGATSVYMEIEAKDLEKFKRSEIFRAHRIIGFNNETNKVKVIGYIGTSKMNTKEMSDFIDYVLDYASQYEIYKEDIEVLLNG